MDVRCETEAACDTADASDSLLFELFQYSKATTRIVPPTTYSQVFLLLYQYLPEAAALPSPPVLLVAHFIHGAAMDCGGPPLLLLLMLFEFSCFVFAVLPPVVGIVVKSIGCFAAVSVIVVFLVYNCNVLFCLCSIASKPLMVAFTSKLKIPGKRIVCRNSGDFENQAFALLPSPASQKERKTHVEENV